MTVEPYSSIPETKLSEFVNRRRRLGDVAIRLYPFPYVAALAVSNSGVSLTVDAFEDWHAFVCGHGATPYGDGLGLEVGDSLTLNDLEPSVGVAAAAPASFMDSGHLIERARQGFLDTVELPAAKNAPAAADTDRLKHRLDRLQSAGAIASAAVETCGDRNVATGCEAQTAAGESAHLDLLKAFGIRFFSGGHLLERQKFGDHLDYRVAARLREALQRHGHEHWRVGSGAASAFAGGLSPLDDDEAEFRLGLFNRTVNAVRTRDGNLLLSFKRYRGPTFPSATSFPAQVSSARLDALEAARGAVIVAQHFGIWSLIGRRPGDDGRRPSQPPVFDAHAAACWRDIAARHRAGRLFVATTGRLLHALWRHDRLSFTVQKSPERWVVTLDKMACPILGDRTPDTADLNGLALLVREAAPEVVLCVKDQAAPLAVTRAPDAANPGFHAVYRPWTALEWPA